MTLLLCSSQIFRQGNEKILSSVLFLFVDGGYWELFYPDLDRVLFRDDIFKLSE
jgi:hypothetical protein